MPTLTIDVPAGVDVKKLERVIKKLLESWKADPLLYLEEESLRDFLEDEPDVYTEEDIKGRHSTG